MLIELVKAKYMGAIYVPKQAIVGNATRLKYMGEVQVVGMLRGNPIVATCKGYEDQQGRIFVNNDNMRSAIHESI